MTTEIAERALLDWLLAKYPETPRKRAKEWIQAGRVTVNGVAIRQPHHKLADPGAGLALLGRQAVTLDCGASGLVIHPRVTVLFLDGALAVVNKGAGLLAVSAEPGDLSAQSILGDYLLGKLRTARPAPAAYRQLRPLPVHRLDQHTTGVFCLAMNAPARQHLIGQLSAHTMRREYIAYVEGQPRAAHGTWRDWLKTGPDGLHQMIGRERDEDAVTAVTHYEVLAKWPGAAKLRLRLETGRTHQIRVQAQHAGLPLIGDRNYGARFPRIRFDRQALHAERLALEHPVVPGKPMSWTAPLPRDLRELEQALTGPR